MSNHKWTEEEDAIIMATYDGKTDDVVNALRDSGYERTHVAVKARAQKIGATKRRMPWSDEEEAIIASEYPNGSVRHVHEVLTSMGYHRTLAAVNAHALLMGLGGERRMTKSSGTKKLLNVVFDTELDRDTIEYLRTKRNRSRYIRGLIEADMIGESGRMQGQSNV